MTSETLGMRQEFPNNGDASNNDRTAQNLQQIKQEWQEKVAKAAEELELAKDAANKRLAERHEEARRHNNRLIEEIIAVERRCSEKLAEVDGEIAQQKKNLEYAHADAAVSHALAGLDYDREALDVEKPFRVRPVSSDHVRHERGLQMWDRKGGWVHALVVVAGTVALGFLMGMSIGVKIGAVEPDASSLTSPSNLPAVLIYWAVGTFVVAVMGIGIYQMSRMAASKKQLFGWTPETKAWTAAAIMLFCGCTLGDAFIQMTGLMKIAESTSFNKSALPAPVYFLMCLVISGGFFVYEAMTGIGKGLNDSASQVISGEIAKRQHTEEHHRRNHSEPHRKAAATVAQAKNIVGHIQQLNNERDQLLRDEESTRAKLRTQVVKEPIDYDGAENALVMTALAKLDTARREYELRARNAERGVTSASTYDADRGYL